MAQSETYTTGDIARILGRTLHEVTHIVGDAKHDIPMLKQRRGNNRLFGPPGLEAVRAVFEQRDKAETDRRIQSLSAATGWYNDAIRELLALHKDAAATVTEMAEQDVATRKAVKALIESGNGNARTILEIGGRLEQIGERLEQVGRRLERLENHLGLDPLKDDKAGPAQRAGGRLSNV